MSEPLLYERDGHVGIITFNRPDKLNALTPSMMQQLDRLLDQINVELPRSLEGRGLVEVQLEVEGILSNRIQISFQ